MTLRDRIAEIIQGEGPIPVSTYMALCLHDPQAGYYSTQSGLGRDFITAPEISQVFGELLGLWAVHEWHALGAPSPFILAELGPGHGSLMCDALRAASRHADFMAAMQLWLVEASPKLRAVQKERLARFDPQHIDDWRALPEAPAITLANEFLDCLPARQFVRTGHGWAERVVGLDQRGGLCFGLAEPAGDEPREASEGAAGELDVQPALGEIAERLAAREAPFRALFIDYGPMTAPPGETLRAFLENEQIDPLADPGRADLTVDVDFARFSRLARARGLDVAGPVQQGALLRQLGIQARLDQLVAANPDEAQTIFHAVSRLVDPDAMGARFKAVCLSTPGLPAPAAFETGPG